MIEMLMNGKSVEKPALNDLHLFKECVSPWNMSRNATNDPFVEQRN